MPLVLPCQLPHRAGLLVHPTSSQLLAVVRQACRSSRAARKFFPILSRFPSHSRPQDMSYQDADMCFMQDEELSRVHELFAGVCDLDYPATDISARQWLKGQGASPAMLDIAEACYANDFGCSLDQLGLTEMITESRRWDAGACPSVSF